MGAPVLPVARYLVVGLLAAAASLAGSNASAGDPTLGAYSADTNFYCALNVDTGRGGCAASQDALRIGVAADLGIKPLLAVLIARLYDNASFDITNGYLDVYAGADCTVSKTSVDYQNPDLGAWKNRVSSFASFGNCATRVWSGTSYSGSVYPSSGYLVSSSNVGVAMNDNAESAQFS